MTSCEIIEGVTLHQGDCRDIMREMPADHFDAIITDPPYGISFAGEKWDTATPRGFQAWCESWATEALRVLKPGGYMLAFGAPRAYHRLTAGIEDAGFEIRDAMAWIRAAAKPTGVDLSSAFDRAAGVLDQREGRTVRVRPEDAHSATHMSSHLLISAGEPITDEARAWEGWGTGLKPLWEPIVVARRPLEGTLIDNVRAYGTGAMNIRAGMDAARGMYPPNLLMGEEALAAAVEQGAPDHVWPVFRYQPRAPKSERPIVGGGQHVTVKPLELIRYLIRLVVRPGSLILEPFAGSGTTLQAAAMEGVNAVGCELDERYIPLIHERFRRGIEAPLDILI
nr:MAG TPA: adenine-specific methyltransferase [Caudoviricetes sp.]